MFCQTLIQERLWWSFRASSLVKLQLFIMRKYLKRGAVFVEGEPKALQGLFAIIMVFYVLTSLNLSIKREHYIMLPTDFADFLSVCSG